jgi:hypothetical protein
MFPKHSNARTCFENIMYKNLQCTIGNKNYPDEPVQTQGARFLQGQLVAAELDGIIEPSTEYQISLTKPKNDKDGKRLSGSSTDCTSFMFNVQLERSNAGYCIDGIETNGRNIAVQLKGGPINLGVNDTYYCARKIPGRTGNSVEDYYHPPAPEAWICQETFWRLTTQEGLEWLIKEQPPGIQVEG